MLIQIFFIINSKKKSVIFLFLHAIALLKPMQIKLYDILKMFPDI